MNAVRTRPGFVICDRCPVPALRIVGDTLEIVHVHHGQRHTTVLTLSQILDKMEGKSVP